MHRLFALSKFPSIDAQWPILVIADEALVAAEKFTDPTQRRYAAPVRLLYETLDSLGMQRSEAA